MLALGFFDGVHIGHGALLHRTRLIADRLGVTAAALTFDTHPDLLVYGHHIPLLGTMADRELLMRRCWQIDEVSFLHFDRAMMELPWESFVDDILIGQYHAVHLVCGHDFSFGARGAGTPERLKEKCRSRGIGCDIIQPVTLDGQLISSTFIRGLLEKGETLEAARYLGHPHLITGVVERGQGLGHTIGIPTANLSFPPEILVPAYGVYAARVLADGKTYSAVVNIGLHPTVGALEKPVVEACLLDFSGDLYGKRLEVSLFHRLRPEQKFSSVPDLQAQIAKDKDITRALFESGSVTVQEAAL